ncbi:MAG: MBL fold metallo-hydrolase [Candidatus Bathyarchaeota archaeon]|nr:MBL fold metallo-hydrolase [Candidatus Bathyarchaeota archaeon]
MQIEVFPVGNLQTNCYVVSDSQTKEALIIDPGFDYTYEAKQVVDYIEKAGLKINCIINTHGHHDHIGGDSYLQKKYGVPVYIHPNDKHYLTTRSENAHLDITTLKEGELIRFGAESLKVMETPGHSPGSICLVSDRLVFSGDTLFAGGIGRTDFEGGSGEDMAQSLKKLMALPENFTVYPGHYEATTIGQEKNFNSFF